ncbi:9056_t:CDS:10 [Ambispora gerdemannii]|uniref:9056_t:CDS:1 n=1 Tax=Ambispora gerdemannii TaxID=144530 RepID=A0A9N8WTL7_9GLOM|nr:9056_t:CDS:10 [Ambispora gerdemannii]
MELQHRSIQINSVRSLATSILNNSSSADVSPKGSNKPSTLKQLWSLVNSLKGIISSNAVSGLVSLVRAEALPWLDVLTGLTDALATAPSHSLTVISLLEGITSVLVFQLESQIHTVYPFSVKGRKVHPFITAVTTKPETWVPLLSQLELIFEPSRLAIVNSADKSEFFSNALEMLKPFLNFVLLGGIGVEKQWSLEIVNLLFRSLQNTIDDDLFRTFREQLLYYLLGVSQKIPLVSHDQHTERSQLHLVQSLVHVLRVPYIRNSLSHNFLREYSSSLGLQILSLLCDAHYNKRSLNDYLRLLSQLINLQNETQTILSEPNSVLFWPALCYLLLDAQSIESQTLILDLLDESLRKQEQHQKQIEAADDKIPPMLIDIVILPLFQLVAELGPGTVRNQAMELTRKIEKYRETTDHDRFLSNAEQKVEKEVSALLKSPSVIGTLADILAATNRFVKLFVATSQIKTNPSLLFNRNSPSDLLFLTSYLFHPNPEIRIKTLSTITAFIDNPELAQNQKITIFFIILYLLSNDPLSSIHLHIFYHSFPELISPNDPIITAKLLKLSLSLVERKETEKDMKLGAVGVRLLHKLWEKQKRCWRSLRFVLSEWVQRRKLKEILDQHSEEYEMEIAVLVTIRDICKAKARDYAEELIPFLSSLLQSVVLLPTSMSLIIEALNASVEADVVDPRAAWTVILSYIADAVMQTNPLNIDIISSLCQFYQIAAVKSDESEVYIDFKQDLLSSYIRPLIFPSYSSSIVLPEVVDTVLFEISSNKSILKHALRALSYFRGPDILSIFPEYPKILLSKILLEVSNVEEWQLVFNKLIHHEIDNMRRGLFKNFSGGKSASVVTSTGNEVNKSQIQQFKEHLLNISQKVVKDWESGTVNPGLRNGYAIASLIAYRPTLPPSEHNSQVDIKSTRFYRMMINGIQDIALTDHWIVRVNAIHYWWRFFENGLHDFIIHGKNDEESTVQNLVNDLFERLTEAKFPVVCQSVILSLTGLCLSLKSLNILSVQTHAGNTLRHLLRNYVSETASAIHDQKQDWSLISSDEVQFAVMLTIGHLATLISMDERLTRKVVETMIEQLNDKNSSSTSEWAPFASCYGLGILLSHLVSSPTKTVAMSTLCTNTVSYIYDYLSNDNLPLNIFLGSMLGLANIDREEEPLINNVYQKALGALRDFVEMNGKDDGNKEFVVGSVWFLAFSQGKTSYKGEVIDLLEKAMQISGKAWKKHYFHFAQAYSHALQKSLELDPSSHHLSSFNAQIHSHLRILTSPDSTSNSRHTSIITLGTLAGIDFVLLPSINDGFGNTHFFKNSSKKNITEVVNSLTSIAGLGTETAMISDLKGGRLAAIILARLFKKVEAIDREGSGESVSNIASISSEPKDYSRLPITSYLRAFFDGLTEIATKGNLADSPLSIESANLILSTFTSLNCALPPVNWFTLLSKFNNPTFKKYKIHHQSILMASRHASKSFPLMEFLAYTLIGFSDIEKNDEEIEFKKLLINYGLAKILEISGFASKKDGPSQGKDNKFLTEKRMDISKTVVVPNSRVLEIVNCLVADLFKDDASKEVQELQVIFLTTMVDHLVSPNTNDAHSVGAVTALYQDLLKILKIIYSKLPSPITSEQIRVTRLITQCAISTIDDLSQSKTDDLKKYTLVVCTFTEFFHLDSSKYLTQLLQECLIAVGKNHKLHQSSSKLLLFSWIARAICLAMIGGNNQTTKQLRLSWLVRILDVLIVVSSKRTDEFDILEYGVKVVLSGIVNTCWIRENVMRKEEEWDDSKFSQIVQDSASIRRLTLLVPNEVDAMDIQIKDFQKQIIKRLFRLLEISRELKPHGEIQFVFNTILKKLEHLIPEESQRILLLENSL